MKEMHISKLLIYPIKSTKGIELQSSEIEHIGLKHDRNFAIINDNNKVITARENAKLLKISSNIDNSKLKLSAESMADVELNLSNMRTQEKLQATIFNDETSSQLITDKINDWVSEITGESSRIIKIDSDSLRKVKEKHNGKGNDRLAFNDACPIHLVSQESVDSLNESLEPPVSVHHFRPNIVVRGCHAYEEESWKMIKIGDCLFEVAKKTGRCVLTTIDPNTTARNKKQEPLRSLAKLRGKENGINFGVYLIPRELGTINIGDKLEIIS